MAHRPAAVRPTIFYVNDTLQLDAMKFNQWQTYVFWDKLKEQPRCPAREPGRVHTYEQGPAAGADLVAVDRVHRRRDRTQYQDGYLFFIAKGDGSGMSAFARRTPSTTRTPSTARTDMAGGLPVAADFAAPLDAATRRRWAEADRSHRPGRVAVATGWPPRVSTPTSAPGESTCAG